MTQVIFGTTMTSQVEIHSSVQGQIWRCDAQVLLEPHKDWQVWLIRGKDNQINSFIPIPQQKQLQPQHQLPPLQNQ